MRELVGMMHDKTENFTLAGLAALFLLCGVVLELKGFADAAKLVFTQVATLTGAMAAIAMKGSINGKNGGGGNGTAGKG